MNSIKVWVQRRIYTYVFALAFMGLLLLISVLLERLHL